MDIMDIVNQVKDDFNMGKLLQEPIDKVSAFMSPEHSEARAQYVELAVILLDLQAQKFNRVRNVVTGMLPEPARVQVYDKLLAQYNDTIDEYERGDVW